MSEIKLTKEQIKTAKTLLENCGDDCLFKPHELCNLYVKGKCLIKEELGFPPKLMGIGKIMLFSDFVHQHEHDVYDSEIEQGQSD